MSGGGGGEGGGVKDLELRSAWEEALRDHMVPPTPCPRRLVPELCAICLRACSPMTGAVSAAGDEQEGKRVSAAICLGLPYAVSGTHIAYGDTRPVNISASLVPSSLVLYTMCCTETVPTRCPVMR
eukprot:527917-Rhodomonas_salina.1